jgi:uncharacterized membrane protein
MMLKDAMKGAVVAGMVASLFAGGTAFAKHEGKSGGDVKCSGINDCKGKGACSSAEHSCAGKNDCKGKGWIKVSEKDCQARGGAVVK